MTFSAVLKVWRYRNVWKGLKLLAIFFTSTRNMYWVENGTTVFRVQQNGKMRWSTQLHTNFEAEVSGNLELLVWRMCGDLIQTFSSGLHDVNICWHGLSPRTTAHSHHCMLDRLHARLNYTTIINTCYNAYICTYISLALCTLLI